MGCGCSKSTQQNQTNFLSAPILEAKHGEIFMREDFIPAIYRGPNYTHIIPSRTGILKDYNLKNYGFGKNGTHIRVHKTDAERFPELYEVVPPAFTVTTEHEKAKLESTLTVTKMSEGDEPFVIDMSDKVIDSPVQVFEKEVKPKRVAKPKKAATRWSKK